VILVVEDERAVRELTGHILKDEGFQVLAAENGPRAMDLVRVYEGNIDLLLTDVIMPEMNGKELANQLRSGQPDMRVLYMSGYGEDVIAHRGALDEGIDFLAKPFSLETLIRKVRQVLEAPAR
jgi:CheY-like chemotaxis protein